MPGLNKTRKAELEAWQAGVYCDGNQSRPTQKPISSDDILNRVWEEALKNTIEVANDLQPDRQSIIDALKSLAEGAWVKDTPPHYQPDRPTKVYQRVPDLGAIKLLLQLMNTDLVERSAIVLSKARADEFKQRTEYNLAGNQAKLAAAQSKYISTQDTAYKQSSIDRETAEEMVKSVARGMIEFLKSVPLDSMQTVHCLTEYSYGEYIKSVVEAGKVALSGAMEIAPQSKEQ